MNLFQLGDFTLNSGAKSSWKLECDALTSADISALAQMIRELVGPFCSVVGVPRGGLLLADALGSYRSPVGPHLIVDDVLTTGNSMIQAWKCKHKENGSPVTIDPSSYIIGAVVFARGPCPYWIKAVFQMPPQLWIQSKTGDHDHKIHRL